MNRDIHGSRTLLRKVRAYCSNNGISSFIAELVPLFKKEIIRRRSVTADELIKESNDNRRWVHTDQSSVSITEPDNRRLRDEFESYPKNFDPSPGTIYEIRDCDLIGQDAAGLYEGTLPVAETFGYRFDENHLQPRNKIFNRVAHTNSSRPQKSNQTLFHLVCPDPSYYHWVIEYLPKLRYLELYQNITGKNPDILIAANPSSYVINSLKLAGFDPSRYQEWSERDKNIKTLILCIHRPHVFPAASEPINYNPSLTDIEWLRDRMRSNVTVASDINQIKKIYISRQGATNRSVDNYEQVGRVLEKHEFQSVKLESLHFNKQLRLLANAEVICGPHGAGLVNMIFADEPDIVEILPDSDIRPHFYYLSDMLDLDYHPLIADTREKDMTVDTTQLDRLLTRIID